MKRPGTVLALLIVVVVLLSSSFESAMGQSDLCDTTCKETCSTSQARDKCMNLCVLCCVECDSKPPGTNPNNDDCPCSMDNFIDIGE